MIIKKMLKKITIILILIQIWTTSFASEVSFKNWLNDFKKEATQKNDKVVAVWAIESKGFRSFRYDRVKSIKVLEYGNGTEAGANY